MKKHIKTIFVCLFILLGIALLCYGSLFHSTDILAQEDNIEIVMAKNERELIKLASIGGLMRDESGWINQTFAVGEKPPETCAT
ncbi:MAG: hypothetical protein JXA96_11230 [Sedimentisphaerales bacterium]|nr:hypothetical protein [Sedimentisphaerales bacterium]